MSFILNYNPGQTATVIFETLNAAGARSDGYGAPSVARIINPALMVASGFPQNMTRIDTGLYYFSFPIPTGASSVGSYIVDISFLDPDHGTVKSTFFQLVVSAPNGLYSISTV